MDFYSKEYRDKLIAEHRLIVAMIERVTDNHRYYKQRTTIAIIDKVSMDLRTKKFELELKIDVLSEFLES